VPGAAIFHLVTHAFFKGLLFLGAGSVIHGMGGEQDMRKMGGLRAYMPVTFATMLVATLAIAGVPPLAGFFSKDEILWGAMSGPHAQPLAGIIGYVVAGLTAFYMGRLFILTFLGILIVYTATNVALSNSAWDPYPFILLNLFLSMLAALQAPVIMMSQNRQDTKDRLRGELDFEVNRRAETEIQALARKLNLVVDKLDDLEDAIQAAGERPARS